MTRPFTATGAIRAVVAALFVVALFGGGVALLLDPTALNAFRWLMAMLFIGAVALYLVPRE